MNINLQLQKSMSIFNKLKHPRFSTNPNLDEFDIDKKTILNMKPERLKPVVVPRLPGQKPLSASIEQFMISFEQQKMNNVINVEKRDPRYGILIPSQIEEKLNRVFLQLNSDIATYFSGETYTKYDLIIKINKTYNELKQLYTSNYKYIVNDHHYKASNFNIKIITSSKFFLQKIP